VTARGARGDAWGAWENFERRVRERENSDLAVCGSSGTVFFRGFQRYIDPRKLQEEKKNRK
jgi:hypothetical protein